MFQFLKYLLHKQIIEMCHSQNLRRPLSVPCPTQCHRILIFSIVMGAEYLSYVKIHCYFCPHIFWVYVLIPGKESLESVKFLIDPIFF